MYPVDCIFTNKMTELVRLTLNVTCMAYILHTYAALYNDCKYKIILYHFLLNFDPFSPYVEQYPPPG